MIGLPFQMRRLRYRHADGRCAAQIDIVRFLLLTSCRRNEIVRLRWSEVDGDRVLFVDSKTGPRTIPLGSRARAIIAEWRAQNERIGASRPTRRIAPRPDWHRWLFSLAVDTLHRVALNVVLLSLRQGSAEHSIVVCDEGAERHMDADVTFPSCPLGCFAGVCLGPLDLVDFRPRRSMIIRPRPEQRADQQNSHQTQSSTFSARFLPARKVNRIDSAVAAEGRVREARVRGARSPGGQDPEVANRPASRRNRAASGQAEASGCERPSPPPGRRRGPLRHPGRHRADDARTGRGRGAARRAMTPDRRFPCTGQSNEGLRCRAQARPAGLGVIRSARCSERSQKPVPLEDTAHFAVFGSMEPAFDRARHVSRSKGAMHHRDSVPTKVGPRSSFGIRDPGERLWRDNLGESRASIRMRFLAAAARG